MTDMQAKQQHVCVCVCVCVWLTATVQDDFRVKGVKVWPGYFTYDACMQSYINLLFYLSGTVQ